MSNDNIKGSVIATDNAHYRVIQGSAWHVDFVTLALAAATAANVLLRTPVSTLRRYVLRRALAAGAVAELEIFENPTINADGTPLVLLNRRRDAANDTPSILAFSGPTIGADGVRIERQVPALTLDANREWAVWVLKPNEEYLLRVTNRSAGAADFTQIIDLYETNK